MKGKAIIYAMVVVLLLSHISCTANMLFRGDHTGSTAKVGHVVVVGMAKDIDSTIFKDVTEVSLNIQK